MYFYDVFQRKGVCRIGNYLKLPDKIIEFELVFPVLVKFKVLGTTLFA